MGIGKILGFLKKGKEILSRVKKGIKVGSKVVKAGLNVAGKVSKIVTGGKENKVSRFVEKAQNIRKIIKHGATGAIDKAEAIRKEGKGFVKEHGRTIKKAYKDGKEAVGKIRETVKGMKGGS